MKYNGDPSGYEYFAFNRSYYDNMPITRHLMVHEILLNFYSQILVSSIDNLNGYKNIKVAFNGNIRLAGSFRKNDRIIRSLAFELAEEISKSSEIINDDQFSEVGEKARDGENGYYMSLTDSGIILIMEIKEENVGNLIITKEVNFYIRLPKNIEII
jgi:hypothetical protein